MGLKKNDIMRQVQALGYSQKDSREIVEALMEIIKSSLESGEDILISGFGKLCVKEKAPRRGRNPATGEGLALEARRVVTFRSSGKLRERINREDVFVMIHFMTAIKTFANIKDVT